MKTTTNVKLVEYLLDGLLVDGVHHKQWYLEKALRAFCGNKFVEKTKKEARWEEGIPP